jgi:GrpB-like predicted nucleotidyltransferase (UPF0157 family)/predicted kinase
LPITTLHLICGLPCAGKTTYATTLAQSRGALRLTPDEWLVPLIGADPSWDRLEAARDPIEALLWEVAAGHLSRGVDVILDFGFWTKSERDAFRGRAAALGARSELHFLQAPLDTLRARLTARNAARPGGTFFIDERWLQAWWKLFEAPDVRELQPVEAGGSPQPARAGRLTIVSHQSGWAAEYAAIARNLQQALGTLALRIDHIGSTAVPGLCAKDVIDVQISVAGLGAAVAQALGALGYRHITDIVRDHQPPGANGADDDWSKWFFREPAGARRTHVHVRVPGKPNERYPLLFRDYLIAHPDTAQAYGLLKRRLAESLANPDDYPDVKDPAVDLIYLPARHWAKATGWQPQAAQAHQ